MCQVLFHPVDLDITEAVAIVVELSEGFSTGNRGYSGKSKSLYNSVCKQWNYGTYSYGERCNLWRVCWSYANRTRLQCILSLVGGLGKLSKVGNISKVAYLFYSSWVVHLSAENFIEAHKAVRGKHGKRAATWEPS